jgi:uncharacterized protein (TIGR02466 family)
MNYDLSNCVVENIFGDYIYISEISENIHQNYTNNFFEELEDNVHIDSWSFCDTKSSFFHDELLSNYNQLDNNQSLSNEVIEHCNKLLKFIENDCKEKFNCKASINQIWHNIYKKHSFQEVHSHSGQNSSFSFVYIAKLDSTSKQKQSRLFFINPRHDIFSLNSFDSYFSNSRNYMNNYVPDLKEGNIIIFPSHLSHGVTIHEADNLNRITISGNIQLIPM